MPPPCSSLQFALMLSKFALRAAPALRQPARRQFMLFGEGPPKGFGQFFPKGATKGSGSSKGGGSSSKKAGGASKKASAGGGGSGGGSVVATGTPEEVSAVPESYTGQYLVPLLAKD